MILPEDAKCGEQCLKMRCKSKGKAKDTYSGCKMR